MRRLKQFWCGLRYVWCSLSTWMNDNTSITEFRTSERHNYLNFIHVDCCYLIANEQKKNTSWHNSLEHSHSKVKSSQFSTKPWKFQTYLLSIDVVCFKRRSIAELQLTHWAIRFWCDSRSFWVVCAIPRISNRNVRAKCDLCASGRLIDAWSATQYPNRMLLLLPVPVCHWHFCMRDKHCIVYRISYFLKEGNALLHRLRNPLISANIFSLRSFFASPQP